MAPPRFLVPEIARSQRVNLSPEDTRHAIGVLRLRIGDRVALFDGCGMEAEGEIVECRKSQVSVLVADAKSVCRELANRLDLYVSLPKGDRQKQLVDMLVQLGVHSLTPLVCERSVAQPTDNAVERLRRVVVETSKQCGRNQLMVVQPPVVLANLVRSEFGQQEDSLRFFAHPYGSFTDVLAIVQSTSAEQRLSAGVMVGPEGGFSEEEADLLRNARWRQVSLGSRILRVETAAIAIAAIWSAWNEQQIP